MKLQYWHNGGFDTIALLDATGEIVGSWPNVDGAVEDFFAEGMDPDEWDANGDDWRPGGDDQLVAEIDDSGELTTPDPDLLDSRREFWSIA